MKVNELTCLMCGARFDPRANPACPTCPIHSACTQVCCPECGHTTVDPSQSRLASWALRLFHKEEAHNEEPAA